MTAVSDSAPFTWETRGFEAFRRGTFGNAGQNLYVSRAGVLQRIHQYDLTGSGHVDLVFCNSQDHCECPPAYAYQGPSAVPAPRELPADGARAGTVADLTGDGYDDLVIGNYYNGVDRVGANAIIYFGAPAGWSERYTQLLPAPWCVGVAAGDFHGDGRPALAFLCAVGNGEEEGRVRLFRPTTLGFEAKRYVDLEITGRDLAAADLDGDGYADLVVRASDGRVHVYWGGPDGLAPAPVVVAPVPPDRASGGPETGSAASYEEVRGEPEPRAQVVRLRGQPHVFVAGTTAACLVPARPDRTFGPPLVLNGVRPMAVGIGHILGTGGEDVVVACREPAADAEASWVYPDGGSRGYAEAERIALRALNTCDVAVADLGDGRDSVVLVQHHDGESFDTEALVFGDVRPGAAGPDPTSRLPSHGARRVLVGRSSDDARLDVVLLNSVGGSKLGNVDNVVYLGGPDGYRADRRLTLPGWGSVEAICADLNDDGWADLVFANASENSVDRDPGSYVYVNSPAGFPDVPSLTLPTTRAHGAACGDLNGDGYLDLVFGGFDNPELLIFHGTADGFDTEHPTRIRMELDGEPYSDPRWLSLADLNNDGHLDLIVPQSWSDRCFILWGGGDGFSMERCQVLPIHRAVWSKTADLTGNGYLDLIVGAVAPTLNEPHDCFVYIYWNSAAGLNSARRTMLPATHANCMAVADFNNDGRLDLFVGSYNDNRCRDLDSFIYWNREGRFFSAADRTRLFTHSASGCFAADLNGNGWTDLAVANHKVWGDHVAYSEIWWNGPDGFDPKRTTRLPTSGPHGMVAVGPGNIMDHGPEETYVSEPIGLPEGVRVDRISWEGAVPAHTWVKAQWRGAQTAGGLSAAAWRGGESEGGWCENGQSIRAAVAPGTRWFQYRLALGARNSMSTPRLTAVTVTGR